MSTALGDCRSKGFSNYRRKDRRVGGKDKARVGKARIGEAGEGEAGEGEAGEGEAGAEAIARVR